MTKIKKLKMTKIEFFDEWDVILQCPEKFIGKKSLYGFQCFITGVYMGNIDEIKAFNRTALGVSISDFDDWIQSKFKFKKQHCSFELALKKAKKDDEKAFDIWVEWFKEFKKIVFLKKIEAICNKKVELEKS